MALVFREISKVLVGPQGDQGLTGDTGLKGATGNTGEQGPVGLIGDHGRSMIVTQAEIKKGESVITSFDVSTCNIVPILGDFILSSLNKNVGKVIGINGSVVTVIYSVEILPSSGNVILVPEDQIFETDAAYETWLSAFPNSTPPTATAAAVRDSSDPHSPKGYKYYQWLDENPA
jgi:hypothetical protein